MIIIFCLPGAGQVLNDRSAVTVTAVRPRPRHCRPDDQHGSRTYTLAGCQVSSTDAWALVLGSFVFLYRFATRTDCFAVYGRTNIFIN